MDDTDLLSYNGDAVPRKRRRPALACDQCRRRKVKCDQKMPCDQCQRSKNLSIHACSYAHIHAAVGSSSTGPHASLQSQQQSQLSSAPPAPIIPIPQVTQRENCAAYPSPSTANVSGSSPHVDDQGSDIAGSTRNANRDHQSAATIQALVDRVRLLEKKLSESTSTNSISCFPPPRRGPLEVLDDPQGSPAPASETFSKTRFFGKSHWMNCAKEFEMVCNFKHRLAVDNNSEISRMMDRCKTLARAAKIRRPIRQLDYPDLKDLIPPRETADELVKGYLRTFESVYRILHVPTFQQEYLQFWNSPQSASQSFVVRLLLVMAIGTCFYQRPDSSIAPRTTAAPWIYAAQEWLGAPSEKSRVNIAAVQVHCLLLLARQNCAIDGDLAWISAGSLLRVAMYVGLHRDPQYLPKMPVFQAELRRRLWATILEILLQSSMDAGGSPLVSLDDYDCEPPSNINDQDMSPDESTAVPCVTDGFTNTSVQIALIKSFPIRLQIAKALNDICSEPSYDEVLRLSSELIAIHRDNSHHLFNTAHPSQGGATQPSVFQVQSVSILINRFLLALHHPFAVKAKTDPKYYFSRKICMDAALHILSPNNRTDNEEDDANATANSNTDTRPHGNDFECLKLHAGGLIRGSIIYAQFAISLELIYQLQEDRPAFFPSNTFPLPSPSSSATQTWRRELHAVTQNYMRLTMRRIQMGETNVKGYTFSSCILAQIKAMEAGALEVNAYIMEAAKEAVDQCHTWLKERVKLQGGSEVEMKDDEGNSLNSYSNNNIYGDGGGSSDNESQRIEWVDLDSQFLLDIPDSWIFPAWPSGNL
ncbi:C6 zinc finger domain-containing protein [Histoplasma capsulatum var. duboisii H88]|uniref:C6 zinc finger domain-containing protein n=1 Tax=Ajellomyces capsulatus (strain H88) TaxID=544711 RepID=A0A8A1LU45_AJEC8|nr:C6 zinc finger domain-containing protein [Histoplasma capsulatum var. duboisii H88]